jgi:hypothetical protein
LIVVVYIRTALFDNRVSLKFIYFDNLKILAQKNENCPTLAQAHTQRTQKTWSVKTKNGGFFSKEKTIQDKLIPSGKC